LVEKAYPDSFLSSGEHKYPTGCATISIVEEKVMGYNIDNKFLRRNEVNHLLKVKRRILK